MRIGAEYPEPFLSFQNLRGWAGRISAPVSQAQISCPPCPKSLSKWVAETMCFGLEPVPSSRKQLSLPSLTAHSSQWGLP